MITINSKEQKEIFEGIYWVCQAVSKENYKPALQYVKVEIDGEKVKFIGCDGHRLHIFRATDLEGIEPGLYEIKKCTRSMVELVMPVNEELSYPNYNSTIPNPSDVIKSARFSSLRQEMNVSTNYAQTLRQLDDNYSIDFTFFKQFIAIWPDEYKIMISKSGSRFVTLILKKGTYFGILMPIKVGDQVEWVDSQNQK